MKTKSSLRKIVWVGVSAFVVLCAVWGCSPDSGKPTPQPSPETTDPPKTVPEAIPTPAEPKEDVTETNAVNEETPDVENTDVEASDTETTDAETSNAETSDAESIGGETRIPDAEDVQRMSDLIRGREYAPVV